MDWGTSLSRIRRKLRDPSRNVWTDGQLLRLFNEHQIELVSGIEIIVTVEVLPVPSAFQMTYMYPWEWEFASVFSAYVYQAFYQNYQSEKVCSYRWEMLPEDTSDGVDSGRAYTHPWEAFTGCPNSPPPIHCGFLTEGIKLLAYDKDFLEFKTLKEVQQNDPTWETRTGEPFGYRRHDISEDVIYLHPTPVVTVWPDIEGSGSILFDDESTISGDYGLVADITGAVDSSNYGVSTTYYSADNNLLAIVHKRPKDLTGGLDEESDLPIYTRKFVEYGVCESAYMMNTDGRIESLGDYWGKRKKFAKQLLEILQSKRRVDRVYTLAAPGVPNRRKRMRPRLPDAYPYDGF